MSVAEKKVVLPDVVVTPTRFRNAMGKYTIKRNSRCVSCGLCARLCPYGVHPRYVPEV